MADTPSPTGTPVLPPKYVPVLLVVLAGVNAALLALTQGDFPPSVKLVAQVLLATLGPVLAALSPGLRKPDGGSGAPLAKALGAAGSVDAGGGGALSRTWGVRALERSRLLLAVAAVGLVALPAGARAADKLDWAAGPTIPLIRYDIASPVPVQVAAGAGLQLSLTLDSLKRDFLGRSWDLMSFDVMGFGSVINGRGSQFGALSAAAGVCVFSSLVCVDYGHDILSADQHLRGGPGFLLLAFSFNVALAPAAPAAFDRNSWHLPRANTLYVFGGP